MASKYPPSERTTAGKLAVGDMLLIRERSNDQPFGRSHPFDPGLWRVEEVSSVLTPNGRRSLRIYTIVLRSNDANELGVVITAPPQRFNRVLP